MINKIFPFLKGGAYEVANRTRMKNQTNSLVLFQNFQLLRQIGISIERFGEKNEYKMVRNR